MSNNERELFKALKWTVMLLDNLNIHQKHPGIVSMALNDDGLEKWEAARNLINKVEEEEAING